MHDPQGARSRSIGGDISAGEHANERRPQQAATPIRPSGRQDLNLRPLDPQGSRSNPFDQRKQRIRRSRRGCSRRLRSVERNWGLCALQIRSSRNGQNATPGKPRARCRWTRRERQRPHRPPTSTDAGADARPRRPHAMTRGRALRSASGRRGARRRAPLRGRGQDRLEQLSRGRG